MNRPREALQTLQTAAQLTPNNAEVHFKLALASHELGEEAQSMAELEKAVTLDPHHPRAAYNLGLARNTAGDITGALQALLTAEAASPRDPQVPYARATILARLKQWDRAREAAQRALILDPQFQPAATLLQQIQALVPNGH